MFKHVIVWSSITKQPLFKNMTGNFLKIQQMAYIKQAKLGNIY